MKFEYEIPKDSMDKLHKLFDHSFEKMKEAKIRFEKGVETEEDLLSVKELKKISVPKVINGKLYPAFNIFEEETLKLFKIG